jgi:NAD(P)-dependent dehydrogenase (short-subunit alcohol dehydrogenase family)
VDQLNFDGRVAIVTGAGRGIGRAYAHLLAARGAHVVVNDLGGSMDGAGTDAGPAATVAREIVEAGGSALADTSDVSDAGDAERLVATAHETFGRLDILVNNAGIIRWASFPDVDCDDLERHFAVHTIGSFNTARAAWPYMVDQGYGRVVMTTSAGVFGLRGNVAYATAKGAVIGLARTLATEGREHGIKANLVAPNAYTRMAGDANPALEAAMPPEAIAPMVAYLAHESCPVTGEIYAAGGGRFARVFIAQAEGYRTSNDATIEDVRAHWDAINDPSNYTIPAGLNEWSAQFFSHLFTR